MPLTRSGPAWLVQVFTRDAIYIHSLPSNNRPLCGAYIATKSGRIVRNFFHLGLDETSVAVAGFVETAVS